MKYVRGTHHPKARGDPHSRRRKSFFAVSSATTQPTALPVSVPARTSASRQHTGPRSRRRKSPSAAFSTATEPTTLPISIPASAPAGRKHANTRPAFRIRPPHLRLPVLRPPPNAAPPRRSADLRHQRRLHLATPSPGPARRELHADLHAICAEQRRRGGRTDHRPGGRCCVFDAVFGFG